MAKSGTPSRERTDEEVHQYLLGDQARGVKASSGGLIYERLQCHTCHGGGINPGREGGIFGPDLAGVTRRLSRVELADALVYPSKQVADRFKAFELEKIDGTVFSGFITEKTADAVTLVDPQAVRRFVTPVIARLTPQTKSLMPDRLLNVLTDEETRDLLAFLESLGAP